MGTFADYYEEEWNDAEMKEDVVELSIDDCNGIVDLMNNTADLFELLDLVTSSLEFLCPIDDDYLPIIQKINGKPKLVMATLKELKLDI